MFWKHWDKGQAVENPWKTCQRKKGKCVKVKEENETFVTDKSLRRVCMNILSEFVGAPQQGV